MSLGEEMSLIRRTNRSLLIIVILAVLGYLLLPYVANADEPGPVRQEAPVEALSLLPAAAADAAPAQPVLQTVATVEPTVIPAVVPPVEMPPQDAGAGFDGAATTAMPAVAEEPMVASAPPVVLQPPALPAQPPASPALVGGHQIVRLVGDRLSATLYGLTDNGWLYRSMNDGRTWVMVTTGTLVRDFIMNAGNPNVLYGGLGLDCGSPGSAIAPMYRSDDGGVNWQLLPTARNMRPLLTNPADPNMVFAADCKMLFLSVDGGRTWAARPDVSVTRIWDSYFAIDMSAASLVGDPQPVQPSWDQIFAVGADLRRHGVVAFTGEVGGSWVEITDLNQTPARPVAVVAHQTQAGQLWVVAADGVWATSNFGIDWELLHEGLPRSLLNGGLKDLTYGSDGSLYLATGLGMYTLQPGYKVWQFMAQPGVERRSMARLLLTESNPQQVWVNTDRGVFRLFLSAPR